MRKTKTVKLSHPFEMFGKSVTEITVKEPTGGLYSQFGDPRIAVTNPSSGSIYFAEREDVIATYLDQLIEHETGGAPIVSQLSLEDVITVKHAMLSFFHEAEAKAFKKLSTLSFSASKS